MYSWKMGGLHLCEVLGWESDIASINNLFYTNLANIKINEKLTPTVLTVLLQSSPGQERKNTLQTVLK